MNNNIELFLNEEYGYRTFSWKPEMTEDQFVDWWSNLSDSDIIKYYFNINSLPGKITKIKVCTEGTNPIRVYGDPKDHVPQYYCHFHDVDDSFIVINGTKIAYKRTSKRDWKDYWVDHQIKNQKPEQIF
jgi:hypothetical protein